MENNIKVLLFSFLFFSTFFTFSQVRNCGTMDHLEYLKSQDPLLEERMEKNEKNLQRWIDNQPGEFKFKYYYNTSCSTCSIL